jgi:regulation of enolase protein 1 (concanavalin A-like superfamily)
MYATNIYTNEFSDWTSCRLPSNAAEAGVWFNIKKVDNGCYETYYSYNGVKWIQVRHGFFGDIKITNVGIVGASPRSSCDTKTDLQVRFDYYTIRRKERLP